MIDDNNSRFNTSRDFFERGFSYLLGGDFHLSLENYLKGLRITKNKSTVIILVKKLISYYQTHDNVINLKMIISICLMYLHFIYNDRWAKDQVLSYLGSSNKLKLPALILAGTTSTDEGEDFSVFEENLCQTFDQYKGSVISGDTTSGISGIAGKLQELYPKNIKTFGYVPKVIPYDDVKLDSRYSNIIQTSGINFSILEPIIYWRDLCELNTVLTNDVKLIGFGGGLISRFEYRLALLFNFRVGIIESSGREATKLLYDPFWNIHQNKKPQLIFLKNEIKALKNFLME